MIQNKKILLGSKSPRRKELLKALAIDFKVVDIDYEEKYSLQSTVNAYDVPKILAEGKNLHYKKELAENEILITSDTLVFHNDKILSKPKNSADAFKMLSTLRKTTHKVITGVCVRSTKTQHVFDDTTLITFSDLDKNDIDFYIQKFHPLDKAGAYGIQEWIGLTHVENIDGSYFNVMGLPTHKLYHLLKDKYNLKINKQ